MGFEALAAATADLLLVYVQAIRQLWIAKRSRPGPGCSDFLEEMCRGVYMGVEPPTGLPPSTATATDRSCNSVRMAWPPEAGKRTEPKSAYGRVSRLLANKDLPTSSSQSTPS